MFRLVLLFLLISFVALQRGVMADDGTGGEGEAKAENDAAMDDPREHLPPKWKRDQSSSSSLYCKLLMDNEKEGNGCEIAVLAGGSFLKLRSLFEKKREGSMSSSSGVLKTIIGYTGGFKKNPNYQEVCTGSTGHSEAVMVLYDPSIVKYEDLVVDFFDHHSPLYQQKDVQMLSMQHRSIIYFVNRAQRNAARQVMLKRLVEHGHSHHERTLKKTQQESLEEAQQAAAEGQHQPAEEQEEAKNAEAPPTENQRNAPPPPPRGIGTDIIPFDGKFYQERMSNAELEEIKEQSGRLKSERLREIKERMGKGESMTEIMAEMYLNEEQRRMKRNAFKRQQKEEKIQEEENKVKKRKAVEAKEAESKDHEAAKEEEKGGERGKEKSMKEVEHNEEEVKLQERMAQQTFVAKEDKVVKIEEEGGEVKKEAQEDNAEHEGRGDAAATRAVAYGEVELPQEDEHDKKERKQYVEKNK